MSGYTVTITPSGDQAGPQTTIHVDTTSGAARVTELTVRAADGNGLSPQELPVLDLAGLIAALTPTAPPAITAEPVPAPASGPVAGPASDPAASESTTPRPRRARATRPAKATRSPKPTTDPDSSAAPAKSTRTRRRATAAPEQPKSGRAYRRMPEQADVVAAWQQSGSATAVAEHFGVPRHTATGWLRRLRDLGLLEPAA